MQIIEPHKLFRHIEYVHKHLDEVLPTLSEDRWKFINENPTHETSILYQSVEYIQWVGSILYQNEHYNIILQKISEYNGLDNHLVKPNTVGQFLYGWFQNRYQVDTIDACFPTCITCITPPKKKHDYKDYHIMIIQCKAWIIFKHLKNVKIKYPHALLIYIDTYFKGLNRGQRRYIQRNDITMVKLVGMDDNGEHTDITDLVELEKIYPYLFPVQYQNSFKIDESVEFNHVDHIDHGRQTIMITSDMNDKDDHTDDQGNTKKNKKGYGNEKGNGDGKGDEDGNEKGNGDGKGDGKGNGDGKGDGNEKGNGTMSERNISKREKGKEREIERKGKERDKERDMDDGKKSMEKKDEKKREENKSKNIRKNKKRREIIKKYRSEKNRPVKGLCTDSSIMMSKDIDTTISEDNTTFPDDILTDEPLVVYTEQDIPNSEQIKEWMENPITITNNSWYSNCGWILNIYTFLIIIAVLIFFTILWYIYVYIRS